MFDAAVDGPLEQAEKSLNLSRSDFEVFMNVLTPEADDEGLGQETLRIQGGELEDAQTHLALVCVATYRGFLLHGIPRKAKLSRH